MCFYTQNSLHADAATHRSFYTQTLLQRRPFTGPNLTCHTGTSFRPKESVAAGPAKVALLPQFLLIGLHFVTKVAAEDGKSQSYLSFF